VEVQKVKVSFDEVYQLKGYQKQYEERNQFQKEVLENILKNPKKQTIP